MFAQGPAPAPNAAGASGAAGQTTGPLTLADCYRIAEQNQPELAAAQDVVQASEARLRQRHSAYLPRLDAGAGHTQSTYNYSPAVGTDPNVFNSFYHGEGVATEPYYNLGLNFSQTIYDFGRSRGAQARSAAELSQAEHNRERVQQQILLNVRSAYFGVLAGQELVGVRQDTVRGQTRHLDQVTAFFNVGRRPRIDVTRQEVVVAQAQLDLVQAESDLKVARAALATAMGLGVEQAPELAASAMKEEDLEPVAALLSRAEQQRPDVEAERQQVVAAQADVVGARALTRPNLAIASFTNFRSLRFPLIYNFGLGESLAQNLFSGGYNRARLDETRFQEQLSEASLKAYLLAVRQEVYSDYADVSVAREKIALAEKAADEARQNLAFAEGRYSAGVGNIIELTDAEVLAADTQAQVVSARYSYQIALGRLQVATGQEPAP